MKITNVEAIYLRQPEVRDMANSGQDALIVKVAPMRGSPASARWTPRRWRRRASSRGRFRTRSATGLKHLLIGEDPFRTE